VSGRRRSSEAEPRLKLLPSNGLREMTGALSNGSDQVRSGPCSPYLVDRASKLPLTICFLATDFRFAEWVLHHLRFSADAWQNCNRPLRIAFGLASWGLNVFCRKWSVRIDRRVALRKKFAVRPCVHWSFCHNSHQSVPKKKQFGRISKNFFGQLRDLRRQS
jgi:hypothetical protein